MKPLLVSGYIGLGDTVYQRPFIKELAKKRDVFLRTPWPEMFWDLPRVFPVGPKTNLRTQMYNVQRTDFKWFAPPKLFQFLSLTYADPGILQGKNIMETLAVEAGVPCRDFSLPLREVWLARARVLLEELRLGPLGVGTGSLCIVRPPAVRKEWAAANRNPNPRAFAEAMGVLRERGIRLVAVGWCEEGEEWLDPDVPELWDAAFLRGEEPWCVVAAMMAVAGRVLTTQSFALPLGAAVGAEVFTVYGGYASPEIIESPAMGPRRSHAAPDPCCSCVDRKHDCGPREIPNIRELAEAWLGVEVGHGR